MLPLPLSYANRLSAMKGITRVTWSNWFGGKYGDNQRFFAQFAVDAKSYARHVSRDGAAGGPEAGLPPRALLGDRGRAAARPFGWRIGQKVTLQGTIFPGDWTFTIRGIYTPSDRSSTTT